MEEIYKKVSNYLLRIRNGGFGLGLCQVSLIKNKIYITHPEQIVYCCLDFRMNSSDYQVVVNCSFEGQHLYRKVIGFNLNEIDRLLNDIDLSICSFFVKIDMYRGLDGAKFQWVGGAKFKMNGFTY